MSSDFEITDNIIIDDDDIIGDVIVSDNNTLESNDNTLESNDNTLESNDNTLESNDTKLKTDVIKKFKTKEEVELECKLATEQGLIELGKTMEQKKSKEEAFNNLYFQLENEFKDFIPDFNTDMIDKSFNVSTYIKDSWEPVNNGSTFTFTKDSKIKICKMYILNEMTKRKNNNQLQEMDDLFLKIKDMDEQSDEYLDQIDNLEKEQKEKEEKLAKRIIKLRGMCVDRRQIMNYQWVAIVFLTYVSLISLNTTIYQFKWISNNLLFPFVYVVFNNFFQIISSIALFLIEYKLLLGILLGLLTVHIYLRLTLSKKLKNN